MAAGPVSPLVLDRYELKYLIPYSMVEPISAYVAHFCDMDYYSTISENGFYLINSLYFDTPTFLFTRRKEEGYPNRFSLRVRSYGEKPKAPYYFETKEKFLDFCKKRRGRVPIENWSDLLFDPSMVTEFEHASDPHIQRFISLATTYNASPVILTQYRRRAYLSTLDDYARVTFDCKLRFQHETRYNVHPDERHMNCYDHPDTFLDPGHNVILELKCERKIPVWMIELIRRFNLTRSGFSKFYTGMVESYGQQANHDFTFDRIQNYEPRAR